MDEAASPTPIVQPDRQLVVSLVHQRNCTRQQNLGYHTEAAHYATLGQFIIPPIL